MRDWHAEVARELGATAIVMHPTAHTHPHVCSVVPQLLERDAAESDTDHPFEAWNNPLRFILRVMYFSMCG